MEEKSDHRIFSYYIAYYSIHRSKKSFLEGNKTILLGNRQMEWIEYSRLFTINTVDDFDALLKVINTSDLTEFQYLVSGDEWMVSIK